MTGYSLVFGALADPTRRAILTRLSEGEAAVAELAAPFSVSHQEKTPASIRPSQRRVTTMSKTQITAEPGIPQIIITREFDAPHGLVFRAYIEPDLRGQWLGPP